VATAPPKSAAHDVLVSARSLALKREQALLIGEKGEGSPPATQAIRGAGHGSCESHEKFRLCPFSNGFGSKAVRIAPNKRPRRGRGQIPPLRFLDRGGSRFLPPAKPIRSARMRSNPRVRHFRGCSIRRSIAASVRGIEIANEVRLAARGDTWQLDA
jgi:hypothetical protein